MAIVQISRITHRKGLRENLPQLDGAELGWATDTRQLFIGNGTVADGAPVIGNTEILTEYSDLLGFATGYVYKGEAAGYTVQTGPTANNPTVRSIQSKFDDIASVRDFGAVGDGTTDDTAAINRAMQQLFCREINPQIRRSLYFPAGVYKITSSIRIPPYALLWGEGPDSVIIQMTGTTLTDSNRYVARTCDSKFQIGNDITNDNAIAPQYITIRDMSFNQTITSGVGATCFLLDQANNVSFEGVNFTGSLTALDLNDTSHEIAGVDFNSVASIICEQIYLDSCQFFGLNYAVNTGETISSVTISNTEFNTLSRGIELGNPSSGTGATGFRVLSSVFDNIYAEGVWFNDVEMCISAQNTFYDVANSLNGVGSPSNPIVRIGNDNNVSAYDSFQRPDNDAIVIPRIIVVGGTSTTSSQLQHGRYARELGKTFTLAPSFTQTILSMNSTYTKAFRMDYTIVRNTSIRTGQLTVAAAQSDGSSLTLSYDDEYSENSPVGVTLSVNQAGSQVNVVYTTTAGSSASLTYSLHYLA
jgi:hypothetical protein